MRRAANNASSREHGAANSARWSPPTASVAIHRPPSVLAARRRRGPARRRVVQQDPVGVAARTQVGHVIEHPGGQDAGDDGQVPAGLDQDGDGHAGQRQQRGQRPQGHAVGPGQAGLLDPADQCRQCDQGEAHHHNEGGEGDRGRLLRDGGQGQGGDADAQGGGTA